uniref:Uncharacterized protein n=1 Tax=Arundo donax TaxID=35708 RepID=A0A0A9FIR1_ARUDO
MKKIFLNRIYTYALASGVADIQNPNQCRLSTDVAL